MTNTTTEDYLSSIFRIERAENKATVSTIAKYLNVKKPSVSQMIKKLTDEGFVTHDSYDYISLTSKGTKVAKKIVFKHRVIEYFLCKKLNKNPNRVHDEAHRLEHAFDDQSVIELYKLLKQPKVGIHGEQIELYEAF